jgi:hypothetical protein
LKVKLLLILVGVSPLIVCSLRLMTCRNK